MLELCPTAQGWPRGGPCPHGVPAAGSGSARTWPLAPTAIGPSLPAREASCPFGRMGEMEKAPPLPWANTAPLSSYPGERNSQVPAGTVTSPPGNAFPWPAGKGALVYLRRSCLASPTQSLSQLFPSWMGLGDAILVLWGRGVTTSPSQGSWAGLHHFGAGSHYKPTNYCQEGEQAPFISPQLKSFWGPETHGRSMCLAFARGASSPKGFL